MINKAIAKITEEMMNVGDEMTRILEEYLTSICTNEKVAEKILNPNKTLEEFMKQLWKIAKDRQKNSKASMTSVEIIPMLEDYFGITETDKSGRKTTPTSVIDISQFI